MGKKEVYGFARKPGKIENNATKFLTNLGDGSEVRGLGDPRYTMRKSKPRTSTSHQLCELADNVVTDIPLIQTLEVSREGEQVNGGSHFIFLPELQVQSQMGWHLLLSEPMKAETWLPTETY